MLVSEMEREGELLAARVRLLVAAIAALIPLTNIVMNPGDVEPWIGMAGVSAAMAIAAVVKSLASRPVPPRWLGFASTALDVSVVSAAHFGYVVAGQPLAATSGRVVFSAYFVVLASSCLRHDVRICITAGAVAIAEYAFVIGYAVYSFELGQLANPTYGTFRWDNQGARVILLALVTIINTVFVSQSRRYLRSSQHDELTGLPNRRYANVRLAEYLALAEREHCQLVVALADIDRFKTFNDRLGHAAGDEVLRHTASILRSFCRVTDFVARYGGEEFLILMLASDARGAIERLRQLHARYAADPVYGLRITLSIGVAVFPFDAKGVEELTALADRRLYEAKGAGRNEIVCGEVGSVRAPGRTA